MDNLEDHNNGVSNGQARHIESSRASVSIGDEVNLFIKQIDSLAETLPFTMLATKVGYDQAYEKYKEFVEKYCEIESNGDAKSVNVPADYSGQYKKLESRIVGLTRLHGPIRVKRSGSVKGVEEDGQDRQAVCA